MSRPATAVILLLALAGVSVAARAQIIRGDVTDAATVVHAVPSP